MDCIYCTVLYIEYLRLRKYVIFFAVRFSSVQFSSV